MRTDDACFVPEWPAPARVRSLITTRRGGSSAGPYASFNLGSATGDDPALVEANRALLRRKLPSPPKWLRQVHGTRVVSADGMTAIEEADASYARTLNTVCAVLVADCMPVLLCDRSASVVAIAHAGWRGMSAGVIERTIDALGVHARELVAFLGPAIGAQAFEVGDEVREEFIARDVTAASAFARHNEHKWLADLEALARLRLTRCGVSAVYGGGMCTYREADRFYSYRRDRTTGRMAALIWLEP